MAVLKEGSRPPWVSLGASVWVQIAAGNSYTFPLYSPSLKSVLGFNQQQLTLLGVANDIGENIGILPGLACNKFPPWAILLVGVCASFLGYGVLWLVVSQTVKALPYWVLWIALCIATHGSAWLGTAVLVTNMRNFPISRGTVAGILKGYVGLSAAVFTEVYTMALDGSSSNLLLLLTLGIPIIGEGAVKKKRKPRRGEDFKFREAVVKADFWLLWSVYFLGVGSGVTVLNNLAQIGVSLGVNDATVLLSLFSFCNFLGRLGAGVVSEHFVRSKTIPRTFCLAIAQILMIVSFLLYASALSGTLYAATALLGVCFGTQFGVMIPTASELFGLKDFGIIFNFMQLGNPAGALIFSTLLASQVYESEAAKQQASSCMGPSCFRLTFLVLAGVCGLGTLLSIILTENGTSNKKDQFQKHKSTS